MLNTTDCRSIGSAAIKLLELLQTDWAQPQFTLRQKVAVGDIFCGTVLLSMKSEATRCDVAHGITAGSALAM